MRVLTIKELTTLRNTLRIINGSGMRDKLTPVQEAVMQRIEKTLEEHKDLVDAIKDVEDLKL